MGKTTHEQDCKFQHPYKEPAMSRFYDIGREAWRDLPADKKQRRAEALRVRRGLMYIHKD
eukprot:COSAG05_NODE_17367_length_326_cov_0.911894_1_plen_59_part_10